MRYWNRNPAWTTTATGLLPSSRYWNWFSVNKITFYHWWNLCVGARKYLAIFLQFLTSKAFWHICVKNTVVKRSCHNFLLTFLSCFAACWWTKYDWLAFMKQQSLKKIAAKLAVKESLESNLLSTSKWSWNEQDEERVNKVNLLLSSFIHNTHNWTILCWCKNAVLPFASISIQKSRGEKEEKLRNKRE